VKVADEDVAAFQVAVHELPFMHVVKPVQDLLDEAFDASLGQRYLEVEKGKKRER